MELTYFGHFAFQLKTKDHTLLFDPFITGNPLAEPVVSASDLKPDVILLTHAHGDHWGDTPQIMEASGALVVANYDITQYIQRVHNYSNVHPMNTGGQWTFDWGTVVMVDARHSSSFPDGSYGGNPVGFVMNIEGKWIYNLGDTSPFAEMAWIGEDYDIDVALMPIGDCFTMGPKGALRAADMIKPALSIPTHYDTFPLIKQDPTEWASAMQAKGHATQVIRPGETITL